MEQRFPHEVIKLIAFHTSRAAFWRAKPSSPWDERTMNAMAEESEAVVRKLESLYPSL